MRIWGKNMEKRILLGSVIAVVILVLVSSSSAVDVNSNDGNEIESVDTTIEIISLISGICYEYECEHIFEGAPLFHRNVSLFSYECKLNIIAFTIKPLIPFFYNEDVNTIHAKRLIGMIIPTHPGEFAVDGIALGNIEWS